MLTNIKLHLNYISTGLMKSRSLIFATQMLFSRSGLSFSTHSRILFSSEYFHCKIFIHEKCLENLNGKFQENLSRPGIIYARTRYRAAALLLRNTGLDGSGTGGFDSWQGVKIFLFSKAPRLARG